MAKQPLPRQLNLKYVALLIAGPGMCAAFSTFMALNLAGWVYFTLYAYLEWAHWQALVFAGIVYYAGTRLMHSVWLPLLGAMLLAWARIKYGPKTEHAVYHHWENVADLGEDKPHKNMRAAIAAIAHRLGEA